MFPQNTRLFQDLEPTALLEDFCVSLNTGLNLILFSLAILLLFKYLCALSTCLLSILRLLFASSHLLALSIFFLMHLTNLIGAFISETFLCCCGFKMRANEKCARSMVFSTCCLSLDYMRLPSLVHTAKSHFKRKQSSWWFGYFCHRYRLFRL